MFQKLLMKSKKMGKNEKGFTLVELIVVVAIIGILTAIAVPMYNNSQKNARAAANKANIRILKGAAAMYLAENDLTAPITWTKSSNALANKYLDEWPEYPLDEQVTYIVTITTDGNITVNTTTSP